MDGDKLALAIIHFYPVDPKADQSGGGTARTDETGKFSYGDEGSKSGLAAGEYKVLVSQTLVNGRPSIAGSGGKKSEKMAGEIENIPDVYRDINTTTLTAKVGKDSRTITLELFKKKQ
ncbi:hypothetical protein [Zavarzinella formosa]|uniref:hypothetical protein n=1 Tax=Zavarzinella formosa TaxID=360055 RepID=UPI000302914D|nr:hypothetical protein [Zavarzinella formosa]